MPSAQTDRQRFVASTAANDTLEPFRLRGKNHLRLEFPERRAHARKGGKAQGIQDYSTVPIHRARMGQLNGTQLRRNSQDRKVHARKGGKAWEIVRKIISISLSSKLKLPHACAGTKPQAARYPHARVFSHPGERRRAGRPEAPYPEGDGGRELGEVVFSPRSHSCACARKNARGR